MPADRAVVRGHLHGGGKELCRPGVGRASEPEQHMRALSRLEQGLGQAEQRRNADPAPDQQRPGARVGEGRGQVGAPPLTASPPLGRGEHVELARPGLRRPQAVDGRDQPVGAELARAGDLGHPARGRGQRSGLGGGGAHRTSPPTGAPRPWSSWSAATGASAVRLALIARWAALAPLIVVMQGMPRVTAARRISYPSARGPGPVGVLITRSTSPASIRSTTCGEPWESFLIRSTGTPIRRIACAVPPVASSSKPRSWSEAASWVAAGLSPSVTEMNTVPEAGNSAPAAAWALPKAAG